MIAQQQKEVLVEGKHAVVLEERKHEGANAYHSIRVQFDDGSTRYVSASHNVRWLGEDGELTPSEDDGYGEIVVISPMSKTEARDYVVRINEHLNKARQLLLDLYERRGWEVLGYSSWRECVREEFEYKQSRLYQLLAAAQVERNISTMVEIGTLPERQLRALGEFDASLQPTIMQTVQAASQTLHKPVTAGMIERIGNVILQAATTGVVDVNGEATPLDAAITDEEAEAIKRQRQYLHDSMEQKLIASDYDGDEWYTPRAFIEAACELMGDIDCDPASNEIAQRIVNATAYFTKDDNGLDQTWHGRVWLNPPYSMPKIEQFTQRLIEQFEAGYTTEAVLLVNNCTDANWFAELATRYPVMFTRGRAKFWQENQKTFSTRQGQAIFYLGNQVSRFFECFAALAYMPNAHMKVLP